MCTKKPKVEKVYSGQTASVCGIDLENTHKINKKSRSTTATTTTARRRKLNPRQATAMPTIATTSELKVSSSNNKVIRKRNEAKMLRTNTKLAYSIGNTKNSHTIINILNI